MKFTSNIGLKLHNRFDIEIKDAKSGDVIQKAQAENIVLDRIYTRILNNLTYFVDIVYGSGTGTLSPSRTTLFNRIGSKAASNEVLSRGYPTSTWTRKIQLGTADNNGTTIREIGISDHATNINTHALITDSEGNPLSIEKTELVIIDIYATVFVEIYNVDSGCFFYANGLRDYLTGGSAPNNNIALHDVIQNEPERITSLTASKSVDTNEKSMTLSVRFNIQHFNKDVRFIDWQGGGLRWKIPRAGVYTGTARTNVELGVGNGSNDTFTLPNKEVSSLVVKVDGNTTTTFTRNFEDKIIFDTPPANGLLVTADYTTKYIPKDSDHVLDVTMKIQFATSQPSPVEPPVDYSGLPGSNTLIGGDMMGGYYGEASAEDLISGEDLCTAIGLTAGTLQNSDAGWLKYAHDNQILYVAKRTIRHSISWNNINAVGAVFGDALVQIGDDVFAVRLLSSGEWNKLIYPVHANYGTWASFSNTELNITGNGGYTWTSTPGSSHRIFRGYNSVEYSGALSPSNATFYYGFRPVLVYLYTV